MIFFPKPYYDELLYSVYARYYIRSANKNYEPVLNELYGKRIYCSNVEFPFAINRLINNLPAHSKYTQEEFIFKNTLYPLYSAFLPLEKSKLIYSLMLEDNGSNLYVKSGMATSEIKKNDYLRFCPECFKEDLNLYGESYWRRAHQVPGLLICLKHQRFLVDSKVLVSADCNRGFFVADEENCVHDLDCFEKFIKSNNIVIDEEKIEELMHDIINKSIKLGENIEYLLNKRIDNNEMQFYMNKYIDALRSKGLTTNSGLLNFNKLQEAFIRHYGEIFLELVQSRVDINFEYNWLRMFFRKNLAIRHVIRHLLLCEFAGIKLDDLFNKSIVGRGRITSKTKYEPYRKKEDVRKEWLELIENNPGISRSELIKLSKKNFIWLLRHDRTWYYQVAPKRKKTVVKPYKKDWNKIDNELLAEVKKAVMEILNSETKPIRITKGYLLKYCSRKRIENLDKMPLTIEYINSVVESLDNFRERKMRWAIESLLKEEQGVTMWKVIRGMGIGVDVSEELKEKVIDAIEEFIRSYA